MVMENFSELNRNNNNNNNNNYLPGFYNDVGTVGYNPHLVTTASPQIRLGGPTQTSFTFTFPTQCSTVHAAPTSIQSTSSVRNFTAPGTGASWQHSIPVNMPWASISSPEPTPGSRLLRPAAATIFTGLSALPAEAKPSCSTEFKRPKRKALENLDDAPSSKVYLCADQFANLQISSSGLGIERDGGMKQELGEGHGVQYCTQSAGRISQLDKDSWERFRELENQLDVDFEEESGVVVDKDTSEEGPCLRVDHDFIQSAQSSPMSILPTRVLEDINKPCMQIILWKSPNQLFRDTVQDEVSSSSTAAAASSTSISPSSSVTATINDNSTRNNNNWNTSTARFPLTSMDNVMEIGSMPSASSSSFAFTRPAVVSELRSTESQRPGYLFSGNNGSLSYGMDAIFDSMDDDMQL